jgi:hypothetical protein
MGMEPSHVVTERTISNKYKAYTFLEMEIAEFFLV